VLPACLFVLKSTVGSLFAFGLQPKREKGKKRKIVFVFFLLDGKTIQRKREMDKLLTKLDTKVFMNYNVKNNTVIPFINFDISVLLDNIDDVYKLYNSICMHPNLTEDIIVSIIKKMCRPYTLSKCWLITQEFCEKYKADFVLTASEMINNGLPVKYIIDTHGNCLTTQNYYYISKYCTKTEFDEYCKGHGVTSPSLENPNLTVEWYLECNDFKDVSWYECALLRADLFTPEVIMKYYDRIPVDSYIWVYYFNRFPEAFIGANLQFKYIKYMELYDCINVFKSHPEAISWNTIDNYMAVRLSAFKRTNIMLTIPITVTDLPCWFVKKYKNIIKFKSCNVNNHFNYNFISRHINNINIECMDIINIRSHYVTMLSDIIGVCEMHYIVPDLYSIISDYC
jgi:hypothetical protein